MLGALIYVASSNMVAGATLWNETSSGDLSDNQAAPNALALAAGTNSIIGTVGGGNSQDWVALTVPAGLTLNSLVLAAYQSSDAQGFTGVQAGSSFVGSPFTASSYLGYAHYGTAATNGALPPANLIGADLLPLMGNNTIATGSTGFSGGLPSGTYTFLIQQLGATTNYQFDYNLVAVPEPAGLILTFIGLLALVLFGRPRARLRRAV
jgi:hypothetical protein